MEYAIKYVKIYAEYEQIFDIIYHDVKEVRPF
jgi:hypothetical protein